MATLIPALGVTPYLTLATRKPVAAVVFTLALVGGAKLVAGAVTCLVYGWDAPQQGRTTMPWEDPDFLLWVFWATNLALAAVGYTAGARRFRTLGPACRQLLRVKRPKPHWSAGPFLAPFGAQFPPGVLHQVRCDRIALDVAAATQQVGLRFDRRALESALKHVPHKPVAPLEVTEPNVEEAF